MFPRLHLRDSDLADLGQGPGVKAPPRYYPETNPSGGCFRVQMKTPLGWGRVEKCLPAWYGVLKDKLPRELGSGGGV